MRVALWRLSTAVLNWSSVVMFSGISGQDVSSWMKAEFQSLCLTSVKRKDCFVFALGV